MGPELPDTYKAPMQLALEAAADAAAAGEVPVGAVLTQGAQILAVSRNAQIGDCDPTAHAEIRALRAGARLLNNYRLPGTTLYVTLEPCAMCCGALIHARVERLVFAAPEPRAGAVVSTRALLDESAFNHRVQWSRDEEAAPQSAQLLRDFFRARR